MLENVCTLARSFEGRSIKISKQSIIMVFFFQMRTEKKGSLSARAIPFRPSDDRGNPDIHHS